MKKRISVFAILLSLVIFIMSFSAPVMASAAMNTDAKCSLAVNSKDPETKAPLVGAEFSLYLVAKPGGNGYELTGSFKNFPVEINGLDTGAMADLAKTMEALAALNGIAPTRQGETDDEGRVSWDGLETGLYLLRGFKHYQDGYSYTTAPVLVYLPSYDQVNGGWLYDVEINAKCTPKPEGGGEEFTEISVKKIWKDDGKERPKEITVHLLRNGESYDTVVLSERNKWEYKWENLEMDSYYVAEDVPAGYTVTVTEKGKTFVITNTKPGPPPSPPPPPPSPPPELPQTGQLWWPIPLLAVLGIVLLAAGFIRNRGGRNEN